MANALNQLEKTLPGVQSLDGMDINYWKSRALLAESESREMRQNVSEMEARASAQKKSSFTRKNRLYHQNHLDSKKVSKRNRYSKMTRRAALARTWLVSVSETSGNVISQVLMHAVVRIDLLTSTIATFLIQKQKNWSRSILTWLILLHQDLLQHLK